MKRKVLGLVGLLVALGALAVAQMGVKGQVQNPSYQGTIPVSDGDGEMNEEMEVKSYANLAKISPEEATRAAQQALGTQAPTKVQLGDENGYLVYEVVIGNQEVKVDAGSGKVLHKETLGYEHQGSEDGGQDSETEDQGE